MNDRFVAAVEAGFQAGDESPTAAAATVRIGSSSNGSRRRAEEMVIEKAWIWFQRNRDEMDIPFAAIIARCPGVAPARVRAGFERRRRSSSTSSAV